MNLRWRRIAPPRRLLFLPSIDKSTQKVSASRTSPETLGSSVLNRQGEFRTKSTCQPNLPRDTQELRWQSGFRALSVEHPAVRLALLASGALAPSRTTCYLAGSSPEQGTAGCKISISGRFCSHFRTHSHAGTRWIQTQTTTQSKNLRTSVLHNIRYWKLLQ